MKPLRQIFNTVTAVSAGMAVATTVATVGLLATLFAINTTGPVGGYPALYLTVVAAIGSGCGTYNAVQFYLTSPSAKVGSACQSHGRFAL